MKNTTKQKESQVQLFELFTVEELESRLEFKRKRRNPRGVSSITQGSQQGGGFIEFLCNGLGIPNNILLTD